MAGAMSLKAGRVAIHTDAFTCPVIPSEAGSLAGERSAESRDLLSAGDTIVPANSRSFDSGNDLASEFVLSAQDDKVGVDLEGNSPRFGRGLTPEAQTRYFRSCSFWAANCATSVAGFSF